MIFMSDWIKKTLRHNVYQVSLNVVSRISSDQASPIDVDKLMNCFTLDCITRVCFSNEVGAVNDPKHEFLGTADNIFSMTRFLMASLFPGLFKFFNIGLLGRM